MSKFIYKVTHLICLLLTLPIIFVAFPQPVYALPTCQLKTDPPTLLSTTRQAKFTINVDKNKNYDAYRAEFKCGAPNFKTDAIKEGDTDIVINLDKSGSSDPCEFSPEDKHEILVFAVINNQEVPQCTAAYPVINANTQCKLSLNPTTGITSSTSLTVSGENLTKDGKFVVFFDDDAIDIPNNPAGRGMIDIPGSGNVTTPNFGPKPIPQELMTPSSHTVSLRQRNIANDWFNPIKSEKDFYGSPLCPLPFTVGTPDKPGSVAPPGTTTGPGNVKVCIKGDPTCTSAGGDPCPGGQGIKTAIGCIHTDPAGFVKDFLSFAVGTSGGLAFLMMLLGAFQMLTSAGNPETLQAGRDRFSSAIIGLLIVILAVLFLKIIGVDILGIPGFTA